MSFTRMDYLGFWEKCEITPSRLKEAQHAADLIVSFRAQFYDSVSAETSVPWFVIGCLDMREENFSHKGYLGNGDPWNKKSVHVPKGRGPFASWNEGAIDAIHISGWDRLPSGGHWDLVTQLMKEEIYNGMGYSHMGLRSPYVWGGTNMQQRGKYTADGHFDSAAWDTQLGTASVKLALKKYHDIDIGD